MRFLAPSPLQNSSTRKIALLAGFSITSPRLPYWAGPRRRDRMGISYPSKNRPKSSIFRCRGVLQWALLFLAFSLFADTSLIEDIRPTIVVDAGHGGTDQGAKAKFPYCEEKRIALQTARLVKKYLDQLGYHVIMTRTTDTFIPLWRRVEIAKQSDAEIFVSLHFNSSRTPTASGIEVFFHNSKEKRSSLSKRLADSILTRVLRRTSAHSRGVKKGNLYVLRETTMPAVLVEGGFISNSEERAQLKSIDYQEKIARGVADGVDYYFRKLLKK